METIQYVNITHRDKDEAKAHFISTSSETGHARVCTVTVPIETVVELHRRGATLKRVPFDDDNMDTALLYIDIDNDPKVRNDRKGKDERPWKNDPSNPPPNLTESDLDYILHHAVQPRPGENVSPYAAWDYTGSTSQVPFKYHVFITLRNRVKTLAEYKRLVEDFELRMQAAFMNLRHVPGAPMFHDPAHSPRHCAYAPPTQTVEPIGVYWVMFNGASKDPNAPWYTTFSPRPHLQLTKIRQYYDYSAPVENRLRREVPPRWSGLARLLHREGVLEREILEEPGADFGMASSIHFLRNGKKKDTSKIPVGARDKMCYITTMALYGQARAYNLWMTQHGYADRKFTIEDLKWTLGKILKKSYEEGDSFTHAKFVRMLDNLERQYGCWSDAEYVEKYKRKECKKKIARTRMDLAQAADKVIVDHQQGDRVVFENKEEMGAALSDAMVSLRSVQRMARCQGLVVEVVGGGKRGRKPGVTWESLAAIGKRYGSTFEYRGKLTPAQTKFVQRQGLTLKKLKETDGANTELTRTPPATMELNGATWTN